MNSTTKMQEIDQLLMRNWALYDRDIDDLLYELDDETYNYAYENRRKYPMMVQMVLEPEDWRVDTHPNIKLKIRDISEKEMHSIELKYEQAEEKKFNKEWEEYLSSHTVERPLSQYDTRCDSLFEENDVIS